MGIQTVLENPTPDAVVRPAGPCQLPTCETVEVSLADFKIVPSHITVRASRVRFVLSNVGSLTHAFEIDVGGGTKRSSNIGPGQTGYLEVELSRGEYAARCPITGHAVRGQRATVEVLGPS